MFGSGDIAIERSGCCLLIRYQPQIADAQCQCTQDTPTDEAEMQAEMSAWMKSTDDPLLHGVTAVEQTKKQILNPKQDLHADQSFLPVL